MTKFSMASAMLHQALTERLRTEPLKSRQARVGDGNIRNFARLPWRRSRDGSSIRGIEHGKHGRDGLAYLSEQGSRDQCL